MCRNRCYNKEIMTCTIPDNRACRLDADEGGVVKKAAQSTAVATVGEKAVSYTHLTLPTIVGV